MTLRKRITWQMSAAYIAKLSLLTAISFLLYAFGFFKLPFMFPGFLEMQFSELPALLAGFSMGPVSGCVVIVLKCLFKLPMSTTGYVGELTDILIGISFVLPAALLYKRHKDKKHALLGLGLGSLCTALVAVLINRFISIPFYVQFFFEGHFEEVVGICSMLYPKITTQNFYSYYLGLAIVPFNLLRCLLISILTFLVYKRISVILHWEGASLKKHKLSGVYECDGLEETEELAEKIAATLHGGEKILLEGELGAGKTAFAKGIAGALGVTSEVTSPTFTILNVYDEGKIKLCHLDMYRIKNEDELYEAGIEDSIPDDAVTIVEWNKLTGLTGRIINVTISVKGENERIFTVSDSADAEEEAESSKPKITRKRGKYENSGD